MKKIVMTFEDGGTTHVEGFGYKDDSCLKDTTFFERLFKRLSQKLKPEAYKKTVQKCQLH